MPRTTGRPCGGLGRPAQARGPGAAAAPAHLCTARHPRDQPVSRGTWGPSARGSDRRCATRGAGFAARSLDRRHSKLEEEEEEEEEARDGTGGAGLDGPGARGVVDEAQSCGCHARKIRAKCGRRRSVRASGKWQRLPTLRGQATPAPPLFPRGRSMWRRRWPCHTVAGRRPDGGSGSGGTDSHPPSGGGGGRGGGDPLHAQA